MNRRTALAILSLVTAGCSIPVGSAGDLRLVPSVRSDELATTGFSAGGSIMGLELGFSMGSRCTGLVSGVDGDARCLGVGVQKKDEPEKKNEPAERQPPVLASRSDGREYLAMSPRIDAKQDAKQKERGVSARVDLFGVGAGLSASGSCVGATTAVDGEGRCLGVGLRPKDEDTAAPAPTRTARSKRALTNVSLPARR
ncbi:MAG: hypothetical protein KIT14_04615 [bacterium]|nr:hypothetical protein [bacterium]